MGLTLVLRETARSGLAALRAADKEMFRAAVRAMTALADQPYPETAVPWGRSGYYRLHAGSARILYEVDEEKSAVYIVRVDQIT